jgi:hypothetical protein
MPSENFPRWIFDNKITSNASSISSHGAKTINSFDVILFYTDNVEEDRLKIHLDEFHLEETYVKLYDYGDYNWQEEEVKGFNIQSSTFKTQYRGDYRLVIPKHGLYALTNNYYELWRELDNVFKYLLESGDGTFSFPDRVEEKVLLTEYPIVAPNLGCFEEVGSTDSFTVDINHYSDLDDEKTYYLALDPKILKPFEEGVQVFKFDVPNSFMWQSENPIGHIFCVTTYDNSFLVPVVSRLDKKIEYVVKSFAGIGFSKTGLMKPIDMYYSGNLGVEFLYPIHKYRCVDRITKSLISFQCKEMISDNSLTLLKNDIPDLFNPDEFGNFKVGNHKYYYMRWTRYDDDFWNLRPGIKINFSEPLFRTSYLLKRIENGWEGSNVYCSFQSVYYDLPTESGKKEKAWTEIAYDMGGLGADECPQLIFTVDKTDEGLTRLHDFWGFPKDKGWLEFPEFFRQHITYDEWHYTKNIPEEKTNIKDNEWKDGVLCFCWIVWTKDKSPDEKYKTLEFYLNCEKANIHENFSFPRYVGDYSKSVWMGSENGIRILGTNVGTSVNLPEKQKSGLLIAMRDDCIQLQAKIDDWHSPESENPFHCVYRYGDYTLSPMPESATTLFTKYNIRTDGIVIGENIESHEYKINGLGENIEFLVVRMNEVEQYIAELFQFCQYLQSEIDGLWGFINLNFAIEAFLGVGEGLLGFIAKKGAQAVKFTEEGLEAGMERGFAKFGEDGASFGRGEAFTRFGEDGATVTIHGTAVGKWTENGLELSGLKFTREGMEAGEGRGFARLKDNAASFGRPESYIMFDREGLNFMKRENIVGRWDDAGIDLESSSSEISEIKTSSKELDVKTDKNGIMIDENGIELQTVEEAERKPVVRSWWDRVFGRTRVKTPQGIEFGREGSEFGGVLLDDEFEFSEVSTARPTAKFSNPTTSLEVGEDEMSLVSKTPTEKPWYRRAWDKITGKTESRASSQRLTAESADDGSIELWGNNGETKLSVGGTDRMVEANVGESGIRVEDIEDVGTQILVRNHRQNLLARVGRGNEGCFLTASDRLSIGKSDMSTPLNGTFFAVDGQGYHFMTNNTETMKIFNEGDQTIFSASEGMTWEGKTFTLREPNNLVVLDDGSLNISMGSIYTHWSALSGQVQFYRHLSSENMESHDGDELYLEFYADETKVTTINTGEYALKVKAPVISFQGSLPDLYTKTQVQDIIKDLCAKNNLVEPSFP